MRNPLISMLVGVVAMGCLQPLPGQGNGPAKPLELTPEERMVVEVAQDFLKKTKRTWEKLTEVKRPPNRMNVPDWKKYVEDEKYIWKMVYETPKEEMRSLGARTLYVNMRTKEVRQSARK